MRLFSAPLLILLVGLGLTTTAIAEQLQVPAEGETQSNQSMDMPTKGMSMEQVEQIYGEPNKKVAPVGDPPITRWVYDRYTVYFEHSYVIHSVPQR